MVFVICLCRMCVCTQEPTRVVTTYHDPSVGARLLLTLLADIHEPGVPDFVKSDTVI